MACAEDEERDLDAAREDNAVGEEGRAVREHASGEVVEGEDVRRIRAVHIDEVREGRPPRGDVRSLTTGWGSDGSAVVSTRSELGERDQTSGLSGQRPGATPCR